MPPKWIPNQQPTVVVDSNAPRPRGSPNCLAGLTFVRTGELSTMTNDQLNTYVSIYGGKTTGAVSGKTNYLIMGVDPGESKRKAAKEKNVKIISETEFYDLVIQRSKVPAKMGNYTESLQPIDGDESEPELLTTTEVKNEEFQFIDPTPYTLKYRPKSSSAILGNQSIIAELKEHLSHPSPSTFAIFVHGPPGTGKTLSLDLISSELDMQQIKINSSMVRTKKELHQQLLPFLQTTSVLNQNQKRVVVIDEAESVDAGGLPFLNTFIAKIRDARNKIPIVFITSDSYNQKLKTIKSKSVDIQFRRTPKNTISKYLFDIMVAENIKINSPNQLDIISDRASGDIRRCLQSLQMFVSRQGFKAADFLQFESLKIPGDVFETADNVFAFKRFCANNQTPYQSMLDLFYNDPGLTQPIIIQNYQSFSSFDLDFMTSASDLLSQSDVILHQMFSQSNWTASRACGTFSTILLGMECVQYNIKHNGFLRPAFPGLISLNGTVKRNRETCDEMLDHQLLDYTGQLEFVEMALKTAEAELDQKDDKGKEEKEKQKKKKTIIKNEDDFSESDDEEQEINDENNGVLKYVCGIVTEEFYEDIQKVLEQALNKQLKKYLKENGGAGRLFEEKKKRK
ncbi:Replication_factor C [Hexamita inflata]|uniref:Subunit 1 n=1 Tax=Hexamita inflata TaxID=28002 RepID=A0AA86QRT3_9EUKA|nr:Replication factor C [Hexamita inflata]